MFMSKTTYTVSSTRRDISLGLLEMVGVHYNLDTGLP